VRSDRGTRRVREIREEEKRCNTTVVGQETKSRKDEGRVKTIFGQNKKKASGWRTGREKTRADLNLSTNEQKNGKKVD